MSTYGIQNIHVLLMIRRPYTHIDIEESVGRCDGADGKVITVCQMIFFLLSLE